MAEKKIEKKEVEAEKNEEVKAEKKEVKAEKKELSKGKYTKAVGRRKTAVAQVRMISNGSGMLLVNGFSPEEYFDETQAGTAEQPIKLVGVKDFDFSVLVKGGGKSAQSEAVRHGISRALIASDIELRPSIKAKGWLTRDSRKVERKKPGLKKARKSPQWSKR